MSKIKAITSHKYFIPILCLFIAALLIFLAGPYFSFAGYAPLAGFVTQLLVFLFIVAGYCLYQYIKFLKSQKQQDKMVEEITKDDGVNEAIDAESAALKEKFKLAFSTLKQKKGGPASLTEIPWYMIIGSPGSGKTTLLSNSGLRFPLANEFDNKAVQGIGGTKNCDWWITQQAVLLDTAGRYASQDSYQKVDESGWKNFLSMIKRYRRKPISGLLVSFSMSDLMTMNEYELSQHTLKLKQRIAEVNEFFGTQFPVYIVITKSDMLAGFTQFFDNFSHKEREQAFGLTFDKQLSVQGNITEAFSLQFSDLLKSISRRQWQRMSLERDANRKSTIYTFSDQLASLHNAFNTIVDGLSRKEEGLSTGIIRGLYLTSGTQSGAPIDRMINKVSQAFGLKSTARVMWNNDQRSYFIKDLLQDLVFAEADKFGTLTKYESRKQLLKRIAMGAAAAVTLGLCIGMYLSYNNNTQYIARSDASVDKWISQYDDKSIGSDADIRQFLPALNDFTNDIEGLANENRANFSGLGLNQSDEVESALMASYGRLLKAVLLPYVSEQVKTHLRQPSDISQQYQALKTYLMLANSENRDNKFIARYLEQHLNSNQYFSSLEFTQVFSHVENLVDSNMVIESVDNALVVDARRTLSAQPLGEIYYKQFKDAYLSDPTKYLSMAQLASSDWGTIFTTRFDDIQTLSKLYTPESFDVVLSEEIDEYIDKLGDEAWILGPDNVVNSANLSEQLNKLYARDYVNSWQALINSVSVKSASSAASLSAGLQLLIETDSPIFVFLSNVSQATKLIDISSNTPNLNLGANASRAVSAAKNALTADNPRVYVTSRFSKLHELMQEDKKLATQQRFSTLLQEVNVNLSFQLQNTNNAFDPSILNGLQGYGYLQTEPLNRWVSQLAGSIQSAQNRLQKTQLTQLWKSGVLGVCSDVVEFKYPFNRGASADASLRDINQLFAPSGALYSFFEQHLAPLINMQRLPWTWKNDVQSSYAFGEHVLPFFENIYTIQRSLYASDGSQPEIQLSLTPVYLDPRLARFRMSIYGKTLNYQFGRPTSTPVIWPPENPSTNGQVSFGRRDGSEVLDNKEGLFALFRLLDASETKRISANKVNVTFSKSDYKAIYELSAASPVDPLVFTRMSSLTCIDSL
ncbi:type VI secretion system membrane subunit TssM [Agaribacter marinus]|uniref:Type VI secretion protein IcmF n=1 Tax=Agaribacter marinus TaxID=1431249 RepID=A0AA37T5H9_9ALTE|nr:type VI secretion system membrane subunit TssM [Agaribacter marinus]GLR71905.1 type VI secretion protein IcmF [Agaribacter marinus]